MELKAWLQLLNGIDESKLSKMIEIKIKIILVFC